MPLRSEGCESSVTPSKSDSNVASEICEKGKKCSEDNRASCVVSLSSSRSDAPVNISDARDEQNKQANHKRHVHCSPRHLCSDGAGARGRNVGNVARAVPSRGGRQRTAQPFSHILVCDFEATCDESRHHFPHEIIEFPVVVVDTARLCVVAEFHSYVRPVHHPKLTPFCIELTGITQAQVDEAPTLPVVLGRFNDWLRRVVYPLCREWKVNSRELRNDLPGVGRFVYDNEHNPEWVDCERMVCFATDGQSDMRKFMHACSVVRDGHVFPPLFYRWIDVRACFCQHFRYRPRKITDMLKRFGRSFRGRQHSGIDDSRNIARILMELMRRGYKIKHVDKIAYVQGVKENLGQLVTPELAELLEEEEKKARSKHKCSKDNRGNK
ncbi:putative exonuclease [Trypanosoma vivax]|nr:putative exonuclease [Trypanosoma vivax]